MDENKTVELADGSVMLNSRAARVLEPGASAYGSLVRLSDGTLGTLHERDDYRHLTLARFNNA